MTLRYDRLAARIARARSACGRGIKYKLGKGGNFPNDPLPTRNGLCDCSGFVSWLIHMNRSLAATGKAKLFGLYWIETSIVYRDATGPQKLFIKLDKPVPGCLVVYPDANGHQGHIGLVTRLEPFTVIDCSSGSSRKYGEAIRERTGAVFLNNARSIYCALKEDVE